jgi:DAPG hydrolase PhiG domain
MSAIRLFSRAAWALGTAALLGALQPAIALAQATYSATSQFTVTGVRPEAYSWLWDNADEPLLKAGNADIQAFAWEERPSSPQHLGYSTGARYRLTTKWGGVAHTVSVTHADPQTVRTRVASDNFLGAKPYSFVAQRVAVDGGTPFDVLVQYTPTGSSWGDSQFHIQTLNAPDAALAQAYVGHLRKTYTGLRSTLMNALNERYFNAVLKKRGSYTIGPVDKKLNVRLTVTQEIKGIDVQMLNWWWDHIGNTARYRLWQPIDHISFEWTVAPTQPDLTYDIGAVQKAREYIGKSALTLAIAGADPKVIAPPTPLADNNFFFATADPTFLAGLLPHNLLTHQWRPNATGDGVILDTTFVNTVLARVLNNNFFDDLGSHALREFQMLPYFLPRLYRREALGE